MITLVSGTNRKNSSTKKITIFYEELLKAKDQETALIDLEHLPDDFIKSALYENSGSNALVNSMQDQIDQCDKFIFITPEYNGSFPGVLKAFIDGLRYPGTFKGKKCALVGVSSGVQGAVLAMSHLTDIFNYLEMNVLAQKPKLAFIDDKMNGGQLVDPLYIQLLEEQAEALIGF